MAAGWSVSRGVMRRKRQCEASAHERVLRSESVCRAESSRSGFPSVSLDLVSVGVQRGEEERPSMNVENHPIANHLGAAVILDASHSPLSMGEVASVRRGTGSFSNGGLLVRVGLATEIVLLHLQGFSETLGSCGTASAIERSPRPIRPPKLSRGRATIAPRPRA
jgi:hypothetical protein